MVYNSNANVRVRHRGGRGGAGAHIMKTKTTSAASAARLGSAILTALAVAAASAPAFAADPGKMVIRNDSKSYVTYYVPSDAFFNCDDEPQRGFMIADVAPGAESSPFTFLRTDGHGCNGRQGQFTLVPTLPNVAAVGQQFSYDSHGGMGFQPDAPTVNYLSRLKQRADGVYVWTVTPSGQ